MALMACSKKSSMRDVIVPLMFVLLITLRTQITEAKIGYFWHITDLHFDSFYSTKGDVFRSCWHTDHPQNNQIRLGRFGDYNCDSPWSLIESAMQTMRSRQGDNVEFVLWTGDGLSHSSRRLLESQRLSLLRNITELLGRTFPSQFVFPVLGHEDGGNFRHLGELWRHWLPSEALQTFEKGGYYSIEQTQSRLRIIVLNTNFMRHSGKYAQTHSAAVRQRPGSWSEPIEGYYHHAGNYHHSGGNNANNNNHNGYYATPHSVGSSGSAGGGGVGGSGSGGHVSALSGADSHESQRQWEWLEDVLAKSSLNKETVYIVGHIPPGSDERQMGGMTNAHSAFSEKNNLRYLRLVRRYSSIIQGQFFGHLHSDSFRILYNEMGKPVSWMMIAPSVTPKKQNVGSNNPGMRLYKFETDTGQVLDYTQFYLNLSQANSALEPTWQAEYNLTSFYYGVAEVSAVALHNLADRFTNPEDPLFIKYYRANSVRHSTQPCEGVCALNHYCAITRVDYHEFRQCLETAASALSSDAQALHLAAALKTIGGLFLLQLLPALLATLSQCHQLLTRVLQTRMRRWRRSQANTSVRRVLIKFFTQPSNAKNNLGRICFCSLVLFLLVHWLPRYWSFYRLSTGPGDASDGRWQLLTTVYSQNIAIAFSTFVFLGYWLCCPVWGSLLDKGPGEEGASSPGQVELIKAHKLLARLSSSQGNIGLT